MAQVAFIISTPEKQTRRQYELQISRAKSHAARISRRPKANQVLPVGYFGNHDSTTSTTTDPRSLAIGRPSVLAINNSNSTSSKNSSESPPDGTSGDDSGYCTTTEKDDRIDQNEYSPWHWMNGTRRDPFGCFPQGDAPGAAVGVDFLTQFVAPNMANINQPFGVANIYGRWLLEHMAAYADLFSVIIATMKGAHDALAGNGLQTDVLAHKTKAMSLLRKRLSLGEADDGAILTILFLALLEEAMGNRAVFNLHRRQVSNMVAARGGINNLRTGTGIKATVNQFETWQTAPFIGDTVQPTYPKQPFSQEILYTVGTLPTGLSRLARDGLLSYETINIIKRITSRRRWSIQASDYRPQDKAVYGDPFIQHEPYFKDFRAACPALNLPDGPDGPPIEKLVCLALMRFSVNNSNRERPRACVYHCLSVTLTEQLPQIPVPSRSVERRALLWVWMMTIDSWSVGDRQIASEGARLLRQLTDRFPETKLWCAEDFERLGRDFLWTSNVSMIVERNWEGSESLQESSFVAISYTLNNTVALKS